jgi:hypothetical protein
MHSLYLLIDSLLIAPYRITSDGFLGFMFGTFVLAWIALLIGEITISVLFLINRRHINKVNADVDHYQSLSMEALKVGDKNTYKAANKLANDAFGKSFFLQMTLSAGFLWPTFLAVYWMNERFADIEFPILYTDYSVGFIFVYIVLFIAANLIFRKIKYKLPYFKNIKTILDQYGPGRPAEIVGEKPALEKNTPRTQPLRGSADL